MESFSENPIIESAVQKVYSTWEEKHKTMVQMLKNGRTVKRYAHKRTRHIVDRVTLEYGMYAYHNLPLDVCLQKHTDRWIGVSRISADITKTFVCEMSQRCMSMAEIVIGMLIIKTRYYVGKLSPEFCNDAKVLVVPHYNSGTSWRTVFEMLLLCGQSGQKALCPEMDVVFERCNRALFNALIADPMVFEKNGYLLSALYTDSFEEVQIDGTIKENLCFGGLEPRDISKCDRRENRDALVDILTCYRDFENGKFSQVTSLLLTVQLSIRVNLLLYQTQEFSTINKKEREAQFPSLELSSVGRVLKHHPLISLFKYPNSLADCQKPLLESVLSFCGESHTVVLELPILYYLFGEKNHSQIFNALYHFNVSEKKTKFLTSSSERVSFEGTTFPKKWTKYKVFDELIKKS